MFFTFTLTGFEYFWKRCQTVDFFSPFIIGINWVNFKPISLDIGLDSKIDSNARDLEHHPFEVVVVVIFWNHYNIFGSKVKGKLVFPLLQTGVHRGSLQAQHGSSLSPDPSQPNVNIGGRSGGPGPAQDIPYLIGSGKFDAREEPQVDPASAAIESQQRSHRLSQLGPEFGPLVLAQNGSNLDGIDFFFND